MVGTAEQVTLREAGDVERAVADLERLVRTASRDNSRLPDARRLLETLRKKRKR